MADLGDDREFVLAALALVPLAWLIGEATEHAAEHTGPGIGGFLNATFGNAPELIIALLAVNEGLTEVVRGSLTGSVVGNLLLVLGFSLLAGGRGEIDRWSTFLSFATIAIAVVLFLIPAMPSWDGDPDRHQIAVLSIPVAIVLLLVYVVVDRVLAAATPTRRTLRATTRSTAGRSGARSPSSASPPSRPRFVAEILVGSLETFADKLGLSDFFVAAVIVAIVGNAAEHGGAVIVAHRGKIELAAEIALASSAQVAVFLIPAVALLSWLIEPLALAFRQVEIAALAALDVAGRRDRARGRAFEPARGGVLLGRVRRRRRGRLLRRRGDRDL